MKCGICGKIVKRVCDACGRDVCEKCMSKDSVCDICTV